MLERATSIAAIVPEVVQKALSLRARQTNARKPVPISQPAPIQFLLFKANAEQRAAFNELFNSALFNARNRKQPRKYLKEASIPVIGNHRITYTGEELRQDDGTVWLQLVHLAKELPPGNAVEFTPINFLKSINWSTDGRSYNRLQSCLTRLQATSLKIHFVRSELKRCASLSMLPFFEWEDSATGKALSRYQVKIDPALVQLFEGARFTRIEWQQRLALPDGIATWLHGYYASHKVPHPIKLDIIKGGAGITAQRKHLREIVNKALEALKSQECRFLLDSHIDADGLVHVVRNNQEGIQHQFRMRNQP